MKTLIYISIFFLIFNISFSQEDEFIDKQMENIAKNYALKNSPVNRNSIAFISRYENKDQIFNLYYDGELSKQLYLNVDEFTEYGFAYLLNGWCKNLNDNEKIDIVGAYFGNKIYLFHIKNKSKKNNAINEILPSIIYSASNSEEEDLLNYKDYNERYIIDFNVESYGAQCLYDNKTEQIEYNIYSNLKIMYVSEFLNIKFNKKARYKYNLGALSRNYNFKIISSKLINNNLKILLYYSYPSNSNPIRMCGLDNEMGFMLVELNNKGNILNITNEYINSCHNFIDYEKLKSQNQLHRYEVTQHNHMYDKEDDTRILIVDLNNLTLKFEKAKKKN